MLLLSQALAGIRVTSLSLRFQNTALRIVQDTLKFTLASERARLVTSLYYHISAEEIVAGYRFDRMLKFRTANNNTNAQKRYANYRLVYRDYYLVEFRNRLAQIGLV